MALVRIKSLKVSVSLLVLLLISQTECGRSGGGSRSSGGGSHSTSHGTSHSSPSHSSGSTSHSSPSHSYGSTSHASPSHSFGGTSHSNPSHSFGGTPHSSSSGGGSHTSIGSGSHPPISSGVHPSYGTGSHPSTFGSGSHPNTFGSGSHSPSSPPGPSAPHLPGYSVTGGAGFVVPPSTGSKPIGFDHVNQQAHNTPLNSGRPPVAGGINPVHAGPPGYTVTGGTPLNNKPSGIGFDHVNQPHSAPPGATNPIHNGPPGYTVTGGAPLPNKPVGGIGFDHVNQQAHNTQLNSGKPPVGGIGTQNVNPLNSAPPISGGIQPNKPPGPIGFDHVNQQASNKLNPSAPPLPPGGITPHQTNPVHAAPFVPNTNQPHLQPNYPANPGNRPGIGFDHVNQQAGGVHQSPPSYQPYRPQTVVQPGGYVHYQPPTQLQYTPPVTVLHTSTHYIPVYQPTVIHTYNSGGGSLLSHGGSFLGGYLVGRLTSGSNDYHHHGYNTHVTNNYYNNDGSSYNGGNPGVVPANSGGSSNTYNSYYTVHHYHQNREQVPAKFSVPGEDVTQCAANTADQLCVPNTNAFCLKNGTIMCTTPSLLTLPCGQNSTDRCVYSQIDCKGNPACTTANQTYIDFYLPCISNVTYVNNKVLDSTYYKTQGSYELCVTAIASPKKLESPVSSLANLITEFGKWHLEQLSDINNKKTAFKR